MDHEDLAGMRGGFLAQGGDQRRIGFHIEDLGEPQAEVFVQLAGLMGADVDHAARYDAVPGQHRTDIDHRLGRIRCGRRPEEAIQDRSAAGRLGLQEPDSLADRANEFLQCGLKAHLIEVHFRNYARNCQYSPVLGLSVVRPSHGDDVTIRL